MSDGHCFVDFDSGAFTFRLPSASPFRVGLSDVTGVYRVYAGWDVHGNDQEFWVVDLPDQRIVLPDDAPGAYQAFTSVRPQLASMGRLFSATCYMPPKAWRSRRFGLFASYRVRAAIVPLETFTSIVPDWTAATMPDEAW